MNHTIRSDKENSPGDRGVFCRYDIWSQRRIADAESFQDELWQKQFQLVYDETGRLAGTAFAFNNHHWRNDPESYALILDPDHPQLAEILLDWVESSGMREIEIIQGNTFLTDLIQSRGYTRGTRQIPRRIFHQGSP